MTGLDGEVAGVGGHALHGLTWRDSLQDLRHHSEAANGEETGGLQPADGTVQALR